MLEKKLSTTLSTKKNKLEKKVRYTLFFSYFFLWIIPKSEQHVECTNLRLKTISFTYFLFMNCQKKGRNTEDGIYQRKKIVTKSRRKKTISTKLSTKKKQVLKRTN